MDRRKFIKDACGYCAGVAGLSFLAGGLSSCASVPVYKTPGENGVLMVPVSSFATSAMLIVRSMKLEYDILLLKQNEQKYQALYMMCTHQDNPLSVSGTGFFCSAHGSGFDLNGNVIKAPALKPLQKFPAELVNDFIKITIQS